MKEIIKSTVVAIAILSGANAAILVEETFDYADGTTLGAGTTGGTGFATVSSSGYYADDALTTQPTTSTAGTTAYDFGTLNVGVAINDSGERGTGEVHRELNGSGAFDNNPGTATTRYLSFTYNSDNITGGARFGFGRGVNETIEFRQIGSKEMRLYWSQAGSGTLAQNVTTTETFGAESLFVVARMDFSNVALNDRIQFSVYEKDGTIVPESFDYDTGLFTMQGGTLDQIYFDAGGVNTRFGNIRLGETFADVTGVPEPSTLFLMMGALVTAVVCRRRR